MFEEKLRVHLTLAIGDTTIEVPAGRVKEFEVDLTNTGFAARVVFWSVPSDDHPDEIFDHFTTKTLIEAKLAIRGVLRLPTPKPDPLVVSGVVTEKLLQETVASATDGAVFFRRYTIRFADPARVYWSQHFPCTLLAEDPSSTENPCTMKSLIDLQKAGKMTLIYNWPVLETTRKIICVGLERTRSEASFYDFLMWFVASENGVFTWDSKTGAYTFSAAKSAEGTAELLLQEEVEEWELHEPDFPRFDVSVLNASTVDSRTEPIDGVADTVQGVRRDVLARTAIPAEFDARKTLETARRAPPEPEVDITFRAFPRITFRPGTFVKFEQESWSPNNHPQGKEYRVLRLSITARANEQNADTTYFFQDDDYRLAMTAAAELKANPRVTLPRFLAPAYPIYAEAIVVSEPAEGEDRTWKAYPSEQSSPDFEKFYKLKVLLWNKQILAPFIPDQFPGHFFFPDWKGERVLVELGFGSARIARRLEWASKARLAADTQGNQILFGLSDKSHTSLTHLYNAQKPELHVTRVDDKDTQQVTFAEGQILFEVKELEATATASETHDVTAQVANAKGELSGKVNGSMNAVSAKFTGASAAASAALDSANDEVSGRLDDADAELSGRIDAKSGELDAMGSGMASSAAELDAHAGAASSELQAARS